MKNSNNILKVLIQGLLCRCPHCGVGNLFERFLKVTENCHTCNENFTSQKADDFPAYIVVSIVGHIILPLIIWSVITYNYPIWAYFITYIPLAFILTLILLQPIKGAVIAYQWFYKMDGFAYSSNSLYKSIKKYP